MGLVGITFLAWMIVRAAWQILTWAVLLAWLMLRGVWYLLVTLPPPRLAQTPGERRVSAADRPPGHNHHGRHHHGRLRTRTSDRRASQAVTTAQDLENRITG